jgi:predicted amidophosphoribosyltransferase
MSEPEKQKYFCTCCGAEQAEFAEVCDACIQKHGGWIDDAPEKFCNNCGRELDQDGLCPHEPCWGGPEPEP